MAVSGLALGGFVIGHLSGNLLLFLGRDAFNSYAEWLHGNQGLLWGARLGLLAMIALHVRTALVLRKRNTDARPVRYAFESTVQASQASRSMLLTGLLVLAYVILHLAHFTWGWLDSTAGATETLTRAGEEVVRHDTYGMVVAGFQNVFYSAIYIAAMVVLALHLSHGFHSLFQSLGLRHPSYTPKIEMGARVLAWGIAGAYMSIPFAVLSGGVS